MVMLVGAPQDSRGAARGVDLSSPYAPAQPYALRGPHLFFCAGLALPLVGQAGAVPFIGAGKMLQIWHRSF